MIVVGRHVFFRAVLRWGAALAFCYPLKHRERFWLRAVELLLSLMALTWLLDPMAQSNSLVQLQVSLLGMYIGFFILLGAMIYACVEIDKKSALYCAVWSLLTAQTAYEGWNLFELLCAVKSHPLNMNSVPVKLLQVLTGVVFYGVICGTLARKIPDKGVYHIGPRQLASAFFMGIMFMLQAALLSSAQALDWPMSVVGTTLIGQLYFLTLLYLQTELFKKSDLQKEMETLNLLYERQRQQYQVARQNVNIINKRCHELRVQIAALRKLARTRCRGRRWRRRRTPPASTTPGRTPATRCWTWCSPRRPCSASPGGCSSMQWPTAAACRALSPATCTPCLPTRWTTL